MRIASVKKGHCTYHILVLHMSGLPVGQGLLLEGPRRCCRAQSKHTLSSGDLHFLLEQGSTTPVWRPNSGVGDFDLARIDTWHGK